MALPSSYCRHTTGIKQLESGIEVLWFNDTFGGVMVLNVKFGDRVNQRQDASGEAVVARQSMLLS